MLKRIIFSLLAALLVCPFAAYGAEEEIAAGFDYPIGYTDSRNEYYFRGDLAVAVVNKEVDFDPIYEWLQPGTQILLPIYVYPDGTGNSVPATDKMIKSDNVTVSTKVLTGKAYVDEITVIDGKKLKLDGVEAGAYVSIPLAKNYDKTERTNIRIKFVLSVNDATYDLTTITLKCYIKNPVTFIDRNTVYGAKAPTQFRVDKLYNSEATFDFGNNVKYTARVKGDETYYLNLDKTPDENIKAMYPDAHLDFYNFLGDLDSFRSTGTLEIPIKRADFSNKDEDGSALYAYKIQNNRLVALGTGVVSFNTKSDTLLIKTSKLENYVLSSKALAQDISPSPDSNILRSGYADLSVSETAQVSGAAVAQAVSSPALAPAPSPASSMPDADDEGYVPEEVSYYNDNLSMGLPIKALNVSSDNPSTSGKTLLPAAFAGFLLSFAAIVSLREKR